ncbi:hypothetical protein [Cellulomonas sp.]|uniref:hypothetical protein n=1 Tax=Cellulomonas sp. TaxID=40001 RepID=UPI00281254AB|nr:hypothetical protein [Cellulomonas sp.]
MANRFESDPYPAPPHLSVFAQPGIAWRAAMVRCWSAVEEVGCRFTGRVLVAPDRRPYPSVSDVTGREVLTLAGGSEQILTDHQVLRIAFRHRSLGVVSLGSAPTPAGGDDHPIELALHAGGLSFPLELRTHAQRRDGMRRWRWAERMLVSLCEVIEAPHGAVGVEATFPSPLAPGSAAGAHALRATTWFLPAREGTDRGTEDGVLDALRRSTVTRTATGVLVHGWDPGDVRPVDEAELDRVLALLRRRQR